VNMYKRLVITKRLSITDISHMTMTENIVSGSPVYKIQTHTLSL